MKSKHKTFEEKCEIELRKRLRLHLMILWTTLKSLNDFELSFLNLALCTKILCYFWVRTILSRPWMTKFWSYWNLNWLLSISLHLFYHINIFKSASSDHILLWWQNFGFSLYVCLNPLPVHQFYQFHHQWTEKCNQCTDISVAISPKMFLVWYLQNLLYVWLEGRM